ncbi:MAG: phage baseplate assembly protein V [bacterium]|nr:phage baseplate assembly protein V [bacterium]
MITALGHLRQRVRNIIARGVVRLVKDDAGFQELQIELLRGEVRARVERFQQYGFSSVPLDGAEALVVFPGGDRSRGIAISVDDRRHRPKGQAEGETVVYNDQGVLIRLLKAGDLEAIAPRDIRMTATNEAAIVGGAEASMVSPEVTIAALTTAIVSAPTIAILGQVNILGDVNVTGTIRATGGVIAGSGGPGEIDLGSIEGVYNSHTHPESGGNTDTLPPNEQL